MSKIITSPHSTLIVPLYFIPQTLTTDLAWLGTVVRLGTAARKPDLPAFIKFTVQEEGGQADRQL